MDNSKMILDFAESLNEIEDVNGIHEYYEEHVRDIICTTYNNVVILLTMCVNKELYLTLSNDSDITVEQYPCWLKEQYCSITEKYEHMNAAMIELSMLAEEERKEFIEYLNHMVKCLMSGIKYIEKKKDDSWNLYDEQNEWNTRFRREERVRDCMKILISDDRKFTKFTMKNHIEIPYMYVLAWDLQTLYKAFEERPKTAEDISYIANLRNNTSIELRHISDNLLDILLYGVQADPEKYEDSDPNAMIKLCKHVSFRNMLPSISIVDEVDYRHDLNDRGAWVKARKNHVLPLVKKDVLSKIPLLPMEYEKKIFEPIKSLEMMIGLLKEENKTKDYLESDMVYLKTCIVEMCRKVEDWISFKDALDFTRVEKKKAVDYLHSISRTANNVPRENSNENKQDYIQKIVHILAIEWDEKNLKYVQVEEKNPETYVEYAYFSVLKLTRNWIFHNLIVKSSLSFAVFLFVIALRHLVDINKLNVEWQREYMAMEIKLYHFFGDEKIQYDAFDISELDKEYKVLYDNVNKKAFEGGKKDWATKFPKENEKDAHQVLNTAGYKKSNIRTQMSENEIFLSFWMSVHYGGVNNMTKKIENTRDSNLFELLERTFKFQKESILLKYV